MLSNNPIKIISSSETRNKAANRRRFLGLKPGPPSTLNMQIKIKNKMGFVKSARIQNTDWTYYVACEYDKNITIILRRYSYPAVVLGRNLMYLMHTFTSKNQFDNILLLIATTVVSTQIEILLNPLWQSRHSEINSLNGVISSRWYSLLACNSHVMFTPRCRTITLNQPVHHNSIE